MKYGKFVHILMVLAALLLFPVLVMWSWNTLAGLYSGPEMQYKHALAVLVLLGSVKWFFSSTALRAREITGRKHKHA